MDLEFWKKSSKKLSSVKIDGSWRIEDFDDHIMIDFANWFLGGGVMNMGLVQEEILFCIYPECLISCLVCEKMSNWEAVFLFGPKRFSVYSGYANTTKFAGWFEDPLDCQEGRIERVFSAIDAIKF